MNEKRKTILIKTDGNSINHCFFDSVEEAKAAMDSQYADLMPEELNEDCEDMSYCGDSRATLYRNGEDVYVWQIIVLPEVAVSVVPTPYENPVNDKVSITRVIDGCERAINLTEQEIERVFRYQDMEYMKEDARHHLLAYVNYDEEDEELKAEFKEEYGLDFDELINNEDVLETLAENFSEEQDCNVTENSTWDDVIDKYLAEAKECNSCD